MDASQEHPAITQISAVLSQVLMKMGQNIHPEKSYSSLYVYFNIVMYL